MNINNSSGTQRASVGCGGRLSFLGERCGFLSKDVENNQIKKKSKITEFSFVTKLTAGV
jgi:hypothetical protein